MSLNILHLSDLHIGFNSDAKGLEELATVISLALEGEKVDEIVVTGDIFDGGTLAHDDGYKELINLTIYFFNTLIDKLNEANNHKISINNTTFIPGNHEVVRKNYRAGEDIFERYSEFIKTIYKEI